MTTLAQQSMCRGNDLPPDDEYRWRPSAWLPMCKAEGCLHLVERPALLCPVHEGEI